MMNKHEHLLEIQKVQFALVDLNLFLDTHPESEGAKKDFAALSSELKRLIWDYEKKYGPLTNFGSAYFQNPDAWINSPWPWENEKGGKR